MIFQAMSNYLPIIMRVTLNVAFVVEIVAMFIISLVSVYVSPIRYGWNPGDLHSAPAYSWDLIREIFSSQTSQSLFEAALLLSFGFLSWSILFARGLFGGMFNTTILFCLYSPAISLLMSFLSLTLRYLPSSIEMDEPSREKYNLNDSSKAGYLLMLLMLLMVGFILLMKGFSSKASLMFSSVSIALVFANVLVVQSKCINYIFACAIFFDSDAIVSDKVRFRNYCRGMAGLVAGRFFTKDWEANKDREKNKPGRCQYGTNSSFVFSPQNSIVDVDSSMRVFGVTSIYHARSITKKCLAFRRKKLCCWHHPDHNPDNITEAELKTRQIFDAFAMLDRLRDGKGHLEEYSFSDPCFEGLRPPLSLDILN